MRRISTRKAKDNEADGEARQEVVVTHSTEEAGEGRGKNAGRGTRSILVRKTEAIDAALGRMGMFVLVTSTDLSSESILDYYREKDGVEKYFDSLKNNLFLKRLRIHSHQTMEGLLFVEFIAMILRSEMKVVLRKSKLPDSLYIPEMLSELRKLKQITFGKKKALTEVSRLQKDIFTAFEIQLDPQTSL